MLLRSLRKTAYPAPLWSTLLLCLLMGGVPLRCRADASAQEQYKLYEALLSKTFAKEVNPCKYPLHLVLMVDTARGMHGTPLNDVQWALIRIGSNFLTAKDRLTLYHFDTAVQLAPGEISNKEFNDREMFGGRLNTLFTAPKSAVQDSYYEARNQLMVQASRIQKEDKYHRVVAVLITHKKGTAGTNGNENAYREALKSLTTSENGMKETRIDRIGEDKKSLTYFILWAIEAEAKGKQSVIEVRNQILLTNDTPYEVSTTPSATPVKVLAVIVAGVLGFFAVQSRQGTKRLKTSVTLRADSRNALPRTLTAENQSIRIFACESSAKPSNPYDIYLPLSLGAQGKTLIPELLLTLSLSEGTTGECLLEKVHPDIKLLSENRYLEHTEPVTLPYEALTRLYLIPRNGIEVELDFTLGASTAATATNLKFRQIACWAAMGVFIFFALFYQPKPSTEQVVPRTQNNVCQ